MGLRGFGDKRRKLTQSKSETRQIFDKCLVFCQIEFGMVNACGGWGYLKSSLKTQNTRTQANPYETHQKPKRIYSY